MVGESMSDAALDAQLVYAAGMPEFVKRFRRELKAMSRLSHPHLTAIIDSGLHDGAPYLVMDFLWSHGPASSEQVRAGLAARRPMKDPTVRTILRRLELKGYATHRVDGRTYIYTCAERPQNVAARAVRQIIDRFCGGSVEQLLVGMVDHEVVDRRELQSLARKIARRKQRGS